MACEPAPLSRSLSMREIRGVQSSGAFMRLHEHPSTHRVKGWKLLGI